MVDDEAVLVVPRPSGWVLASALLSACTLSLGYPEFGAETCGAEDHDGDGLVGCADPDCDATCGEHDRATTCRDGRDNDHDGLVDGLDVGCWTTRSVSFDRCATVSGEGVTLGARLGIDWTVSSPGPAVGPAPPTPVTTPFGDGLEGASPHPSNLLSVTPSTGASAPATLTFTLALRATPGLRETSLVVGPDLPSSLFVGVGATFTLTPTLDAAGQPTLTLVPSNATPPMVLGPLDDLAWHRVVLIVTFASGASADAPSATVTASMDGGSSTAPAPLQIRQGWGAAAALDVGLVLAEGAAIVSVTAVRTALQRCGARDPSGLPFGSVVSGAWTDDLLCVLSSEIDGIGPSLWVGGIDPAHAQLPTLVMIPPDPLVPRLRAIAWDDVRREMVGVLTADGHTSDRFVVVAPSLARADGCGGVWEEIGPMFADASTTLPATYIASRGSEGAAAGLDFTGTGERVLARGDFQFPGSFTIVDRADAGLGPQSALDGLVRIGDDWLLTRNTLGAQIDLLRLTDAACDDCALATVLPSHELGTFDARFVGFERSSALVLSPPPEPGRAWDGLFFYHGQGNGMTWMHVTP